MLVFYFWDNARDRVQAAEGQTEGDTESEAGSRLWAVSPEPEMGLELTNREIMTSAEVRRLNEPLRRPWLALNKKYNLSNTFIIIIIK